MKYLIVGLGNIGSEYQDTRHNIGFKILDAFAEASNISFTTERYGDIARMRLKNKQLVLLKPSTYMNLSGNAVRYWLQKLDIPISNLAVICDDLNLPFGTIRMRKAGSNGGHNGLRNIEELLQTREYTRIRIGVGHEFEKGRQVDFVLGAFSPEQSRQIPDMADRIVSGIKTWAFVGADKAMTQLNSKTSDTAAVTPKSTEKI